MSFRSMVVRLTGTLLGVGSTITAMIRILAVMVMCTIMTDLVSTTYAIRSRNIRQSENQRDDDDINTRARRAWLEGFQKAWYERRLLTGAGPSSWGTN